MKLKVFALLTLSLPLALAHWSAQAAEAGFDYKVLSPAQGKESRAKVEVIEFFSYRCPHCFHLEPGLEAWVAKLPKSVKVKRIPVIFSETWEPTARAYYALEAMGLADKLHTQVFEAMHTKGFNFDDPSVFFDWAAKQGVDANKLRNAYHSFGVSSRIARSKLLAKNYKLEGVPTLAVNGKYITSVSMTGSTEALFTTLDDLIAMEMGKGTGKK